MGAGGGLEVTLAAFRVTLDLASLGMHLVVLTFHYEA